MDKKLNHIQEEHILTLVTLDNPNNLQHRPTARQELIDYINQILKV